MMRVAMPSVSAHCYSTAARSGRDVEVHNALLDGTMRHRDGRGSRLGPIR
jgi:hypothetical protein